MYVNTPGTSTPDGRAIGFETEAFAISDCMNYIKPPVYTIGVGQVLTVLVLVFVFLNVYLVLVFPFLIRIGLHCFVLVFVCVFCVFVLVFLCFCVFCMFIC